MEKQTQGTKYLYRKSNCTLNTRSKTCSGASLFLTRSGIVRLKKNLPKSHYYEDNGKMKRDLSIATDKCILRGIYKRKFGKFKCSVNTLDTETIIESKRDHNSCGDSNPEEDNKKTRLNIDVTTLVVENLKDLLNDWIKKYLLNDNETKQKIDTVLDSILHKLELHHASSSYTYALDIKVDEKKHLNSNNIKSKKNVTCEKRSCQTVPVTGKYIKLISTLSIPRNITRQISTHSQHLKPATRRIRYKNVFLTISRSSTFLLNSSSFNLLSISTKSFIKRCATYDSKEIKTYKKHCVALPPKSSCSERMPDTKQNKVGLSIESKVYPNALEMEPVESLVKSIYADDPANITSTDNTICKGKHDNYTMTDTDYTLKNITSPTLCHKFNWKKANSTTELETMKVKKNFKQNTRPKGFSRGHKIRKIKSMKKQMKSFRCLNKNTANTSNSFQNYNHENYFIKDLQSILAHIINYTDSKNIKFDVKINIFSGLENKLHEEARNKKKTLHHGNVTAAYNIISTNILPECNENNSSNKSITLNTMQQSQPKLISILDGAISQSKYVISKEASLESTDKNITTDSVKIEQTKTLTGIEIAKDISELRVIIRDLATTTENFVKEHLAHLRSKPHKLEVKETHKNVDISINKVLTTSKSVQHSSYKSQIMSGLKLKKEPKKKGVQEFSKRLGKRSISYNVIESESILKVTDMTSVTAEMGTDVLTSGNKTINCLLPESKSLLEVTLGQSRNKLLAFYCDELIKSGQFMRNCNNSSSPNTYKYRCPHMNNNYSQFINENECQEENDTDYQGHKCDEEDSQKNGLGFKCSSVYIDVEDRKKFAVRNRGSMSFWEGLLYCILLWIPVVIIFWLIYVYVIRDIIQPINLATVLPSQRSSNNSLFHITLSDLGF